MLRGYAEAFIGHIRLKWDIPFRDRLDAVKLDYSQESLREVDRYLDHAFQNRAQMEQADHDMMVVFVGAYVGEVARQVMPARGYQWLAYEECAEQATEFIDKVPLSLGSRAVLRAQDGWLTFPFAKVIMFLSEGAEHSTYSYLRELSNAPA